MHADLPSGDARKHLAEGGKIEHVRQALAIGLDQDREAAVARCDGQQVGGPLALLPQGSPRAGPSSGKEESASGILAEARGKERR